MKKLIKSFPKRIHESHITATGMLNFDRMRAKDVAKFRRWNIVHLEYVRPGCFSTCVYVNRLTYVDLRYSKSDTAPAYRLIAIDICLLS